MWSIISWVFFLLSLVFIRIVPLRRPRILMRSRLDSFHHRSHRICTRTPVRLGTVRAGSGMTRAGVYLGSLLISTPGGALRPGSQTGLRCLIVAPDRVSADSLAKGCPTRWRSRSPEGTDAPPGRGARWRTLVCPGGYPYCWYGLDNVRSLSAVL